MSQVEKNESNRLYKKTWVGDTLKYETITGRTLTFNRQRASIKIRDQAEKYGFDVKAQRCFAVSATEFPTSRERAEEGARRFQEWIDHVYSGSDEWEVARKALSRGPSEEDCVEALNRAYPGKGLVLFAMKANELKGDKTPELNRIETVKYWMQTKQVASAWVQIQAERKAASAASFGDADDEVERLLAGV